MQSSPCSVIIHVPIMVEATDVRVMEQITKTDGWIEIQKNVITSKLIILY